MANEEDACRYMDIAASQRRFAKQAKTDAIHDDCMKTAHRYEMRAARLLGYTWEEVSRLTSAAAVTH